MKMLKPSRLIGITGLLLLILMLISGCAESIPIDECVETEPVGFLHGLWHGFIAPLTFIVSLFDDSVAMYAINNNGNWYDFGFVLGAGILFGGSGRGSK